MFSITGIEVWVDQIQATFIGQCSAHPQNQYVSFRFSDKYFLPNYPVDTSSFSMLTESDVPYKISEVCG